jgi:ribonuclease D
MKTPDFNLEFIKNNQSLERLVETLMTEPAFALDIETIEWWNRQREQIALIQIAFLYNQKMKVAVIDALANLDFQLLRNPFEDNSIVKIIHNAGFDVPRLASHYDFNVSPVHDTMRAARFNRERKYSLKAQSQIHLNVNLDKSVQTSNWSKRPLDTRQLYYAALDAYAAFLLYENQISRNLKGDYRLKSNISSEQELLPFKGYSEPETSLTEPINRRKLTSDELNLSNISMALLEIVAELPTRYSPDSLAVSLGHERVGLAGWIIDRRLGSDTDLDEDMVKMEIAELCELKLLQITETRRLIATKKGSTVLAKHKE